MTRSRFAAVTALAICLASAAPAPARSASDVLARRPFAPTDQTLLKNDVYPDGGPMTPAPGDGPSEQQASQMLDDYLAVAFPNDTASQAAAKAVFDDATAKAKSPSPSLRAALAALTGTIAEPGIDYVLHHTEPSSQPTFTAVRFGVTPDPAAIAMVVGHEIIFNERYKGENPFAFVRIMAHEPLHGGEATGSDSNYEETVNSSLDNLVYLRQIARHPDIARLGTELARRNNINAMERLNSGPGSQLGLFATNGNRPVFPGSPTVHATSYWADVDNGDTRTTPGNPILPQYLARFHKAGAPACSGATNDKPLLDCIDANRNGPLGPEELVAAANAMKLDTRPVVRRCVVPRVIGKSLAAAKKVIVA